jgi:hypothetical protein
MKAPSRSSMSGLGMALPLARRMLWLSAHRCTASRPWILQLQSKKAFCSWGQLWFAAAVLCPTTRVLVQQVLVSEARCISGLKDLPYRRNGTVAFKVDAACVQNS